MMTSEERKKAVEDIRNAPSRNAREEFLLSEIDQRDEALRKANNLIEGACTYDPLNDSYKMRQYIRDTMEPYVLKNREALGL